MIDTYKHKGLRKILVRTIKEKGIKDERVLKAIEKIPRHFFVEKYSDEIAYADKALKIDAGQTISQPYTVAYQSELLHIQPGDKVLEIGTGSGYQTAILLELGATVYTIERQEMLYKKTTAFLPTLGYNPHFFLGDGSNGIPEHAPYNKIIVTAGAPIVPETLLKQLTIGGLLVIPVGDEHVQKMTTVLRISETDYEKIELDQFRFVPLIGDKAW
ncbi:protein-L-isoaspartate(D-aspartate) O-methyltransferase [Solitalea koreensis]|uniref:Protein-L-isoaspartate O-methyltransferase n=1 Tax=Solitalea koreensis TaxID=543615 RepID=A0A521EC15_9SPHI|nr:protein-L-isoaspartate(D-aspartate) O-methyltransferase [Solitalea koreensis]SMO81476.1 protein-L-isoaspartate(D-aspartate) O-methyltransferase [Solitalea koreensis]